MTQKKNLLNDPRANFTDKGKTIVLFTSMGNSEKNESVWIIDFVFTAVSIFKKAYYIQSINLFSFKKE